MSTDTAGEFDDEEDRQPVEVDHSPAVLSMGLAVAAGLIATLVTAPFLQLALLFGGAGFLLLVGGLAVSESRTWVSLGAAGIFVGSVLSGAFGLPTEFVLIGVIGALLSWDFGQNAISVGQQLGRQAPTRRLEVVHAAMSTIVSVLVAGIAYGVYVVAAGGQPASALVLLLIGSVLLIWALRS